MGPAFVRMASGGAAARSAVGPAFVCTAGTGAAARSAVGPAFVCTAGGGAAARSAVGAAFVLTASGGAAARSAGLPRVARRCCRARYRCLQSRSRPIWPSRRARHMSKGSPVSPLCSCAGGPLRDRVIFVVNPSLIKSISIKARRAAPYSERRGAATLNPAGPASGSSARYWPPAAHDRPRALGSVSASAVQAATRRLPPSRHWHHLPGCAARSWHLLGALSGRTSGVLPVLRRGTALG